MNKKELIEEIAASEGITKKDARKAVQAFMAVIIDTMREGDRIDLPNFGSFTVRRRHGPSPYYRDCKTGEVLLKPGVRLDKLKLKNVKKATFQPATKLANAVK